MPISRDDLLLATELQILMMEINYLEQCPDASPDEISFMAPESTN